MHAPPSSIHEIVLALFKYGLVTRADEVAIAMDIPGDEANRLCDDLVAVGLLADEPDGS